MHWTAAPSGYDEVFEAAGYPRSHYAPLVSILESFTREDVERRERLQKLALMNQGITFTVYGEKDGLERIFPFDFVPRIIPAAEWKTVQDGLVQRITALNLFISDIYGEQKILRDKAIPAELIQTAKGFLQQCIGLKPPRGIWCHITGTDLIRDSDGQFKVLEDNMRCPSGASYVLENRQILKRTFPRVFDALRVRAIEVPLGAVLFMISDSLISLEKFLWSAALIGPLVWITYALAQLLITRGMLARR